MKEQQLSKLLRQHPTPQRIEATQSLCREMTAGMRTGFWQFLSDILPFVGLRLWALQAAALAPLLLLLLEKPTPQTLASYTPLLVLACLPCLYESRTYNMQEMEAATRSSGAQLLLGKLVLCGATDLVGLTLAVALQLGGEAGLVQLILYALVPFLCCSTATLWSLRSCRLRAEWLTVVLCVALSVLLNMTARQFPMVYAQSATRLWAVAFVVFSVFFAKELLILLNRYRKGSIYGIIDT